MTQLSNAEAMRFSNEHLSYEIEMFFLASEMLLTQSPITTLRQNIVKNALIEVFALHLRTLADFLDDVGSRADDVIARDFVRDRSAWEAARPALPIALAEASGRRANKEVAHITSSRIYGAPPGKGWDVPVLRDAISERLRIFIDEADPARLAQHFIDVFKGLVGGRIDFDARYPAAVPQPTVMSSTASRAVLSTTTRINTP